MKNERLPKKEKKRSSWSSKMDWPSWVRPLSWFPGPHPSSCRDLSHGRCHLAPGFFSPLPPSLSSLVPSSVQLSDISPLWPTNTKKLIHQKYLTYTSFKNNLITHFPPYNTEWVTLPIFPSFSTFYLLFPFLNDKHKTECFYHKHTLKFLIQCSLFIASIIYLIIEREILTEYHWSRFNRQSLSNHEHIYFYIIILLQEPI